ncbi:MAG: MoxR family ATPase [Actinomycetia bacterium]|nr:MoxR family ATPase [Actinomycetes bacterium]
MNGSEVAYAWQNAFQRTRITRPNTRSYARRPTQVTIQDSVTDQETFSGAFQRIADNMERVIQGKRDVIELTVLCMASAGHLLIEDVPGVGKTSIAKALARSVEAPLGRVQFTPDLLPGDVLGVSVWNRSDNKFEFRPGPIFNNIVLADEINRASPKTQSALLESMAEGQVTVDGNTYRLRRPFMVIATQNPIEHEGTFPLPESQLDRFLMRIEVGYPAREAELDILDAHGEADVLATIDPVVTGEDVEHMTEMLASVHLAPALKRYAVSIAEATRTHPALALGMSPRATLALQRVTRARAAAGGRDYVLPDDIKALAKPVLAHRLLVSPEAQLHGTSPDAVLDDILRAVPIPAEGQD